MTMKNIITLLLLSAITISTYAQQPPAKPKSDVLMKVNGDELVGKVTEIGDTEVKFVYDGETLVYSIKKQDILKITYASGRVEFFNKPPLSTDKPDAATDKSAGTVNIDHHNRVAILPFGYIKDSRPAAQELGYKVQNDVFSYLQKNNSGLTILDPRNTNAILIKAGVKPDNMMGFTSDELCNILGVEYVVGGTVTQTFNAASTSSSGDYSTSYKKSDEKTSGYSSTTSTQTFQTNVAISIANDKNATVFNETRKALLAQQEGNYSGPLEYLLKRCPLYKR